MNSSYGRGGAGLLAMSLTLGACASRPDGAAAGARVKVKVAPLASVSGVGDACYDLALSSALAPEWRKGDPAVTALGADQTRNGGPDAAPDDESACATQFTGAGPTGVVYVAPCDASAEADTDPETAGVQNTLSVWVDGLYDADHMADVGGWQDPCPAAGCALQVTCEADADTRAELDFMLLRDGGKGFFDVAVTFDQIFCSAKLDCVSDFFSDPTALKPPEVPPTTAIVGFACTAGAGQHTTLYWEQAQITCDEGTFPVDPGAGEGNLGPIARVDASLPFGAHVDPRHRRDEPEQAGLAGDEGVFQHAVYRGVETLSDSDGNPLDKCYWNMALGLDVADLGSNCFFDAAATAASAPLEGFQTPDHTAYPRVVWHVRLSDDDGAVACTANPLNVEGSGVQTVYTEVADPGEPFVVGAACGGAPTTGATTIACTSSDNQDVKYVTNPDGTVKVLAGRATSGSIPLPPGLHLATECCADPCCDAAAPPQEP